MVPCLIWQLLQTHMQTGFCHWLFLKVGLHLALTQHVVAGAALLPCPLESTKKAVLSCVSCHADASIQPLSTSLWPLLLGVTVLQPQITLMIRKVVAMTLPQALGIEYKLVITIVSVALSASTNRTHVCQRQTALDACVAWT